MPVRAAATAHRKTLQQAIAHIHHPSASSSCDGIDAIATPAAKEKPQQSATVVGIATRAIPTLFENQILGFSGPPPPAAGQKLRRPPGIN